MDLQETLELSSQLEKNEISVLIIKISKQNKTGLMNEKKKY